MPALTKRPDRSFKFGAVLGVVLSGFYVFWWKPSIDQFWRNRAENIAEEAKKKRVYTKNDSKGNNQ